jgi:thiamine-phosphate pyrophosphorylase
MPIPSLAEHTCRLYLISPDSIPDVAVFAKVLGKTLAAGDVACFQLRLKNVDDATITTAANELMPVCHCYNVAFILNDRPDLAVKLGCDGVHIGANDAPYKEARQAVGTGVVGVTCKDSRHIAMELADAGADYVAFGAFFPTMTKDNTARPKPEILSIWSDSTTVPCVAIGGITVDNCEALVRGGADFLAVCNGVWGFPDGPTNAVRAFNTVFERCADLKRRKKKN